MHIFLFFLLSLIFRWSANDFKIYLDMQLIIFAYFSFTVLMVNLKKICKNVLHFIAKKMAVTYMFIWDVALTFFFIIWIESQIAQHLFFVCVCVVLDFCELIFKIKHLGQVVPNLCKSIIYCLKNLIGLALKFQVKVNNFFCNLKKKAF